MSDIQIIAQTLFEPGDVIELRFILKGKPVLKRWTTAQDLPDMVNELDALNRDGYNVYFGPNPRQTTGTSGDDNVKLARCLFCDFDTLEEDEIAAIDKKLRHFPDPSCVVHSGHGIHLYWKLTAPILDMVLWKAIQGKLNTRLGADPVIKNPERIMRLPGFLNTKKEPFVQCYIMGNLEENPIPAHKVDVFMEILGKPQEAPQLATTPAASKGKDYAERKARAVLYAAKAEGMGEGGRNRKAYNLSALLREKFDLTEADRLEILRDWNTKNSPPLDDDELSDACHNPDRYAKRPAGSGYEPLKSMHMASGQDAPTDTIQGKRSIKRRSFADISPKQVEYLIPELLPSGVIVSLISQEGDGKSTLAGYLAAAVSQGENWPTGGHVQQGDVVIFSHEESPECSISPRLLSNGADMSRVHLGESVIEIDGTENELDVERDIQVLDDWADELPGLKFVIFDPITSYVSCNENSNSEVRRALKPLVDFAERRGVTVLALSHLSKKIDLGMINRTLGSRAWSSVPRIIWGLQVEQVKNEDGNKTETGSRYLLCVKCNLGRKPKGLKFSIGDGGKVVFDTVRIDRHIDDTGDTGGRTASRVIEIGEWLIQRLGIESIPQKIITDDACRKFKIGEKRLGVIAKQFGITKQFLGGCWVWRAK